MKATKLFNDFFNSEKSAGLMLIVYTIFSLVAANSGISSCYLSFWHISLANHSLSHWINDGLMAIFFLLVGLELEREIYIGELSTPQNALLPVIAAVGGMVVPAAVHYTLKLWLAYTIRRGYTYGHRYSIWPAWACWAVLVLPCQFLFQRLPFVARNWWTNPKSPSC